jgi:predicted pyridoxine 5'-phosphate oxidase superfamily flavin-nucleotide-binding protein
MRASSRRNQDAQLLARLKPSGYRAAIERALVITVAAFDWNCPQHITPRFTEAEIAAATQPLRERIEALEAENRRLRAAAPGVRGDAPS